MSYHTYSRFIWIFTPKLVKIAVWIFAQKIQINFCVRKMRHFWWFSTTVSYFIYFIIFFNRVIIGDFFLVKICKNCGLNFYAKIQINRESKRLDIFDCFQPLWVALFISDCTAPFIVSIMTNSGQSTMPQPVQDRGKNLQKILDILSYFFHCRYLSRLCPTSLLKWNRGRHRRFYHESHTVSVVLHFAVRVAS